MSSWYFLTIAAVPLLLSSIRGYDEPNITWWTPHTLEKIRPYDKLPKGPHAVRISAARNEFEPFQVVLRAEDRDVGAVDVDFTDLRGPGDARIPKSNLSVYPERFVDLKVPSSERAAGEWPDPLVPRIDHYAQERRNAFPFLVSRGRNQPVWIDVYVPPSTPAGLYTGSVAILVSGKSSIEIPVELQVWDFDLPSTSRLTTTFGFSGTPAVKQHYGRYTSDQDIGDLTTLYQKSALWHRITLDGSSGLAPDLKVFGNRVRVDWDSYDRQIAPFLDGRVFSRGEPLVGGRFTSVVLHTPKTLTTPEQQIQFWRQVAAHFRARGWFGRMFNYLWDEPASGQFPAMVKLGQVIRRADPGVRNLVTAPLHADWSSFVDIWTPLVNCLEPKPNDSYCTTTVRRSQYNDELAKGKQLWWYQSCASHGCNIVGRDYFRGWPSYMIDDAPVDNRIMEWLSWKYDIGGELYFNTNEAYFRKPDPWTDVHLFGGDGTLFYPGRPDAIGGRTDIPIESIRLKLIREGLEDYEYLILLEKRKGAAAVDAALKGLIRSAWEYDQDPKVLYSVREQIGRQLAGSSSGTR
jgi:Glycoside hydrolase 123, catalytic domain/Glycoside hydrolase 123 N-terminal domain